MAADREDPTQPGRVIVSADKTLHQRYAHDPEWTDRDHRRYLQFLVASKRRSEFPGYTDPRGDGRLATLTPDLEPYPGEAEHA